MAPKTPRKTSISRSSTHKSPSASSHNVGAAEEEPGPPKRAQTLPPTITMEEASPVKGTPQDGPDMFETSDDVQLPESIEVTRASVDLDELPIELVTLIDRFIDSLEAKVHSSPPNIEKLSRLFQDFYTLASSHINTHVSALATRQSRDVSPAPSASSRSSATSRLRSNLGGSSSDTKAESEQQMITAEELEARKAARRATESKRNMLEEAVERRLCAGIYDRIYRHRSTEDEAHDDRLRSKTAALAMVGIGPADLGLKGLTFGGDKSADPLSEKSEDVNEKDEQRDMKTWLEPATKELVDMAQARYPLGKIGHLKAAHKNIVDILAATHPSASADDILPVLILTLTTVPPQNLHVISDLHFIQYFRWEPKLTGEAAYCLTNLEAAISFLQGLDLTTLRADESLAGPGKLASQPGTPKVETFPPAFATNLAADSSSAIEAESATKPGAPISGLKAATTLRNRRLSDLVNSPAQAFGLASDAVLTTADQSLKNISNSLGDSYKFLLGKIKERQDAPRQPIRVPRTLEEARKLISTPDEDTAVEGMDYLKHPGQAGLGQSQRDRSTDSNRSGRSASSSKRMLFGEDSKSSTGAGANQSQSPLTPSPAMLEQMRNLSNTFNPMARLSSLSRGLARNVPSPGGTPPAKPAASPGAEGGDLATAFPDIAAALPPKRTPKVAPPNKRFMELQNPGELKLSEVLDLLRDYRRLAGALKNMGAFEEK